ncbi:MAG: 23S rRNA (adenine(2503)-C(2))-methyltransferase RlmN, partial [Rhizobiales bacterium]|nr:23S rRNA (adenine(2503)-C(2))-methyltransferase RlmN [Hyphomicrobiales bacterium]
MKRSLAGLDRIQLAEALGEIGIPERERRMRVSQLWNWIYFRGTRDFDTMTNISKDVRAKLAEHFTLERPEVVVEQVSSDGTRKWLIRLPADTPGEKPHDIEAVYIPESDRGTLCISSQVGCTLNCTFCHTGTQRLVRNLHASEIVAQVMIARDRLGEWPGMTRAEGTASEQDAPRLVTNLV